jgi:AcrR family transcriptional regulator
VTPRKYEAPRREEQAAATRAAIIDAAGRLFTERGYGATTMAAIAAEARVAPKSVYGLGDKAQLLTMAVDRAIVGDAEPISLIDRSTMQGVLAAATGREKARLGAALGAPMLMRLYPLYRAFEQAAAVDPQIADRWRDYQERRRQDVRRVVEAVEEAGPLRSGLDTDRATDTLWALIGWHPVALLVEQRGWNERDIQAWIEDIFVAILLGDAGGR